MKLVAPWPEGYTVNARSPYGPRVHPITGKTKFHHGVDVALPVGTELRAPADGTVVHTGNSSSGGFTLIIRHEGDIHTVYYHLQKPSERRRGDKVSTGEVIAYSGNTGASTGPHLHFEVRNSRKWGDTTDPMLYLAEVEPSVSNELISEPNKPEPSKPEPAPVKIPQRKPVLRLPMSAKLARFFRIRRALK